MKIKKLKRIGMGVLSLVMLGSISLFAQSTSLAMPGTQEGGTARAMSMGSAVVGLPQGSASLFWNPAGLASMDALELGLHHNSGLGEAIQETVVFGMPMGAFGSFAVSLNYVDNGTFEGRDIVGVQLANYTAGDLGVNLGWGYQLLPGFSGGVAVKYNLQTLASQSYSAYSMDAGILWNAFSTLNLGVTYSNLGTTVAGSQMDTGIRVGASYSFMKELLVAVSSELKPAGFERMQAGAESILVPGVALRAGYVFNFASPNLEGLTGLTAGIGVEVLKDVMFDYAYIPYGELGTSHRISLVCKFTADPVHPK